MGELEISMKPKVFLPPGFLRGNEAGFPELRCIGAGGRENSAEVRRCRIQRSLRASCAVKRR